MQLAQSVKCPWSMGNAQNESTILYQVKKLLAYPLLTDVFSNLSMSYTGFAIFSIPMQSIVKYCLFQARFHHWAAATSNMSWHCAEKSFFEKIYASFKPLCKSALRNWWSQRNKHLSEVKLSMCPP